MREGGREGGIHIEREQQQKYVEGETVRREKEWKKRRLIKAMCSQEGRERGRQAGE